MKNENTFVLQGKCFNTGETSKNTFQESTSEVSFKFSSYSLQRAAGNEPWRGLAHVPQLGGGLFLPPMSEQRAYSDVIKDLYKGRL